MQAIPLRYAAIAVIAAAALSLPAISSAQAAKRTADWIVPQNCKIVGSISHRCLSFKSDATWPQGLSDYYGGNGG